MKKFLITIFCIVLLFVFLWIIRAPDEGDSTTVYDEDHCVICYDGSRLVYAGRYGYSTPGDASGSGRIHMNNPDAAIYLSQDTMCRLYDMETKEQYSPYLQNDLRLCMSLPAPPKPPVKTNME